MKKIFLILITVVILATVLSVCTLAATQLDVGSNITVDIQSFFSVSVHEYTFTAPETQYYKFTLDNYNIKLQNSSFLASIFNNFVRVNMDFFSSDGKSLGGAWAKSGYNVAYGKKLEKGQTITIKIYPDSMLALSEKLASGTYNLSLKQLTDIGADTWQDAQAVASTINFTTAVETANDKDWFTFSTPNSPHYFNVSIENIQGATQTFVLYEYVNGAGEFPMRECGSFSVKANSKGSKTYKLNRNSTYYYYVTSGGEGGYILNATLIDDAGGSEMSDAKQVEVNTTYQSSFDGPNDVDYVKFTTGSQLAYYKVYLKKGSFSNTAYATLFDENGEKISSSSSYWSYDDHSYLSFNSQLEPNKLYYVAFEGSGSGSYDFSVTESIDTYPNSREQAVQIQTNKTYETAFDGTNDVDYVKFTTGSQLAYYKVYLEKGSFSNTAYATLFDENGEKISSSSSYWSYDDHSYLSFNSQLEPNKLYYVAFEGSGSGSYDFSVTGDIDEYPNTKENAPTIDINKTLKSTFNVSGDNDYMRFVTASENAYYKITLGPAVERSNSWIFIYDTNGELVDKTYYDSYGNANAFSLYVKLERNTSYYLRLYSDKAFNYEFSITQSTDTYLDTMENATLIGINTTLNSTFNAPGDNDYMKFVTGHETAYYKITLGPAVERSNSWIFIYDTNGELVDKTYYDSYGNANAFSLIAQLEKNSTYYLRFYSDKVFNYEFSIKEFKDPDKNTFAEGTTIYLNQTYQKDLCVNSDVDCFIIDISNKTPLQINLHNESCGKAYFKIINSRDVEITSGGGSYTNRVYSKSATVEAGRYYLSVWGEAGYYTLSLSQCGNGHTNTTIWGKQATCTEDGTTNGEKCIYCDTITKKQEKIKALGHDFKNGYCTRCRANEQCANGHNIVYHEAVEPTCEKEGPPAYEECSNCGKRTKFYGDAKIPLGHKYENGICIRCDKIDPRLNPQTFKDVKDGAWYKNAIDFATVKGLFNGTTANKFEPDNAMTRAMLVTVLWRYAGSPKSTGNNLFSDVNTDQWYSEAVSWAAENNIVNGIAYGKFAPDGKVTREQLAVILYRYAEKIGANTYSRKALNEYPDSTSISSWAKESLEWAVANNFINGTNKKGFSKTVIDHHGNATRAQVATIFMRFIKWYNQ